MLLQSSEDFRVRTTLWEDPAGQITLSVVCAHQGCFDTLGSARPNHDMQDIEDVFERNPEFRAEAMAVPFKAKSDVVLVGTAHAPGGKPVRSMDVSVRVGKLQKRLCVVGDRRWQFSGALAMLPKPTEPEPFTRMPLTYDRAFGGIDSVSAASYPQNPGGLGFIGAKSVKAVHDKPLPNIEDPSDPVTSWDSRPRLPAGFGFYGRGWMPRVKHVGTWDPKAKEHSPEALPKDFSPAFFNAAHPHLQVEGYLRGDEDVELQGVSPRGSIRFRLPGFRPRVIVARWSVDPATWLEKRAAQQPPPTTDQIPVTETELKPVLDTLIFLPDEGVFLEVFRAVVPLRSLDSSEIARIRVQD